MVMTLGIVGRGAWSHNICKTLDLISGVRWARLEAELPSVQSHIDGVIIVNRSQAHVETALPFLKSGISCFIEKPVSLSLFDLDRLRQACAGSGAEVFSGHIHCFNPAVLCFLNELSKLGDIISLNGVFCNSKPREDISVLWDWLPHPVSIAGLIFGRMPSRVRATAPENSGHIDDIDARLYFGDIPFSVHADWRSKAARMEITCECEGGIIKFDDKAPMKVSVTQSTRILFPEYDPEMPLLLELQAFVGVLRGEHANPCGLDQAGYVTAVIESLHRSIEIGGAEIILN